MKKEEINKFLNDKKSKSDHKNVIKWLLKEENEDTTDALMRNQWESISDVENIESEFDKRDVLETIQYKIKLQESELSKKKGVSRRLTRKKNYLIAASVSVILILGATTFNVLKPEKLFVADLGEQEKEKIEHATIKGQKTTFILEDGTKVYLNVDSKISYDKNYGKLTRTVYLEGEAFFEVKKDPHRPFKVITKNSVTTALGTSFNVHEYPDDATIKVSLTTGKVDVVKTDINSLVSNKKSTILEPGEEAVIDIYENKIIKKKFDARSIGWKEDVLYFKNMSLKKTFATLERVYNVSFKIDGDKDLERIEGSGIFDSNEKLANVLELLSYSMRFDYEIDNELIIITY